MRAAATVAFVLLGLAHLHLVGTVLLARGTEPPVVFAGHLLALPVAGVAAWACWRRRPGAWRWVMAYGVVNAALIASLGPALDLPAEARPGLWIGAASVLAVFLAGGWLLGRASVERPAP